MVTLRHARRRSARGGARTRERTAEVAARAPAPAVGAPVVLLVTPDGGDGGPLGRLVAAAAGGRVTPCAPDAAAADDLGAPDLVVALLPAEGVATLTAALGPRLTAPVIPLPPGIWPGHLAGVLARNADLRDALETVGRDAAGRRYALGVEAFFQASHAVFLGGRLGPRHPHSWHVRACFASDERAAGQVLVDFATARGLLTAETDALEGRVLNEVPPFDQPACQPTVENVAAVLFDYVAARARPVGLLVEELTLWENPTTYATCRVTR
ncbi:MAG TPA: 6-carboxytetrahydropterin synthase [Thermomicrobiales bacterium]|nr:6-carboxytetrahydropterin synthase [Thermomicrobiales bacterium]